MNTLPPADTLSAVSCVPIGGARNVLSEPSDTAQTAELSDRERELHIVSCGQHLEAAYARFEAYGNPHDREEALMWLHQQQLAIGVRSAVQKQRMEQVIDKGCCFFQTAGERDRRMLQARGLRDA